MTETFVVKFVMKLINLFLSGSLKIPDFIIVQISL